MAEHQTVQLAVIGEILPNIGVRSRAMAGSPRFTNGQEGRGRPSAAGMSKNLNRVPQSVVKRVFAGGCHNAKSLRRQMEYITRDEAMVASWSNQIGIERSFDEKGIGTVVGEWSDAWVGAPKRGHTDHIILSFPKGTDAESAEHISREWGQEVFGSGFYEDRFRYVAAMHHNTEHVHCHFIVDKVGMDHGNFLSINRFSEINYDMLRELHADIAGEHGLALNATPRLSRGLVENAVRESDVQTANQEGREPHVEPLSFVERARREAVVRGYEASYRELSSIAQLGLSDDADGFLSKIVTKANIAVGNIMEGNFEMSDFADVNDVPVGSIDPAGRLMAARESLIAQAQSTWSTIQEMEPGGDKTDLERQFAEKVRPAAELFGDSDYLNSHTQPSAMDSDAYKVSSITELNDRVQAEDSRFTAQADKALEDFCDGLERNFSPYADRFEGAGTTVEEMAARFASRERTEAQMEAWRPDDPADRASWMQLERELQGEAEKVAATLPVGRDLQEDLAREGLLGSQHGERLADIAALDKLVMEVRADLSDGDMDRVANGQLDPLMDQIKDPGLRSAVGSELRNIAAVEEDGRDVSGRDSEQADRYRDLTEAHARSASRTERERSRDSIDNELEL